MFKICCWVPKVTGQNNGLKRPKMTKYCKIKHFFCWWRNPRSVWQMSNFFLKASLKCRQPRVMPYRLSFQLYKAVFEKTFVIGNSSLQLCTIFFMIMITFKVHWISHLELLLLNSYMFQEYQRQHERKPSGPGDSGHEK